MKHLKLVIALREIYEVWAGSEGITPPITLREQYLIGLIEEMRDIAAAHLSQTKREAKDEN
jgi:CRISPR/Cas system-associated protein Csm6